MPSPARRDVLLVATAGALVLLNIPAWGALAAGLVLALASGAAPPPWVKTWSPRALQAGVVALGAGMDLQKVLRVGAEGAGLTAASLVLSLALAWAVGRALKVERDTSLLLGVGTAICGGSAIASVAGVLKPKPHELSVSLATVFLLNALALVLFPPLGHALGMGQQAFGQWAALAIHDTSSVVGAGLAYGPEALEVATTTKLARALWIVPVTLGVAAWRARTESTGGTPAIKWPWFILGFLALAAVFTWVPALSPAAPGLVAVGRKLLVLALFLVGLGLSRDALRQVGWRAFAQGVVTWLGVAAASAFWVLS
ncbi:MAG: hypothetical protein RL653_3192 [Pseudomonadota bacterium]